ncbi:hypothetical protein HDU96_007527 [Phlyctochytrium bullatum]|nr:hypothetical protein HDU96_007527 [Phlyctochytrium bullatum]
MTKITQYLIRSRRILLKTSAPKLEGIKKKVEKRERSREAKAQAAARLEFAIEKELLERLKKGVYGADGIVNANQNAFANVLDQIEEMENIEVEDLEEEEDLEEMEQEYEEDEDEDDGSPDREFVSDVSDDEEDNEDIEEIFKSARKRAASDGDEEFVAKLAKGDRKSKRKRMRSLVVKQLMVLGGAHVVVEYEEEQEKEPSTNR